MSKAVKAVIGFLSDHPHDVKPSGTEADENSIAAIIALQVSY